MLKLTDGLSWLIARAFPIRFSDLTERWIEVGPHLLILSGRYDARGVSFYWRGGPRVLSAHCWKLWNNKARRNARIPGGLVSVSIPCWRVTMYAGYRARGGVPGKPHGPWKQFRAGVTRNPNRVPFSFG